MTSTQLPPGQAGPLHEYSTRGPGAQGCPYQSSALTGPTPVFCRVRQEARQAARRFRPTRGPRQNRRTCRSGSASVLLSGRCLLTCVLRPSSCIRALSRCASRLTLPPVIPLGGPCVAKRRQVLRFAAGRKSSQPARVRVALASPVELPRGPYWNDSRHLSAEARGIEPGPPGSQSLPAIHRRVATAVTTLPSHLDVPSTRRLRALPFYRPSQYGVRALAPCRVPGALATGHRPSIVPPSGSAPQIEAPHT